MRRFADGLSDGTINSKRGLRRADLSKAAGVFAHNHNLNTSQDHYGRSAPHTTSPIASKQCEGPKRLGCRLARERSFGMGESDEDIVDVGFALRELEPDSVQTYSGRSGSRKG
jgi:biotin synthase